MLETAYVRLFSGFGIDLVQMPNIGKDIKRYIQQISVEGIILSGGGDVDPSLYGGDSTNPGDYSLDRDETEKSLLETALVKDIPVLGICRGMQVINVYFNGKLLQDMKAEINNKIDHVGKKHKVTVSMESIVDALGTNTVEVNSYHNQGIAKAQLSEDLVSFANAQDQTIEAVYHPGRSIAAVMWHPERSNPPTFLDKLLIKSFVVREAFWRKRK